MADTLLPIRPFVPNRRVGIRPNFDRLGVLAPDSVLDFLFRIQQA